MLTKCDHDANGADTDDRFGNGFVQGIDTRIPGKAMVSDNVSYPWRKTGHYSVSTRTSPTVSLADLGGGRPLALPMFPDSWGAGTFPVGKASCSGARALPQLGAGEFTAYGGFEKPGMFSSSGSSSSSTQ